MEDIGKNNRWNTLSLYCPTFLTTDSRIDFVCICSGVIYGISNTLATVPGMAGPYLMGLLTNNSVSINNNTVINGRARGAVCPPKFAPGKLGGQLFSVSF